MTSGVRYREDVGFEMRCDACAKGGKSGRYWPITTEFWQPGNMVRCRACNLAAKCRDEKRRRSEKAAEIRAKNRAYYAENQRLIRAKQLAYYYENAEKIRAWNRAYSASRTAARRALQVEIFGSHEAYVKAARAEGMRRARGGQ